MAGGKRKSKRRLGTRQKKPEPKPETMSSSISSSQPVHSNRPSSDDGTQSEPATSDSGAPTAMTSLMGSTDDDLFGTDEDMTEEDDETTEEGGDDELDNDFQSVYFANQYPQVPNAYSTETPYAQEDGYVFSSIVSSHAVGVSPLTHLIF